MVSKEQIKDLEERLNDPDISNHERNKIVRQLKIWGVYQKGGLISTPEIEEDLDSLGEEHIISIDSIDDIMDDDYEKEIKPKKNKRKRKKGGD